MEETDRIEKGREDLRKEKEDLRILENKIKDDVSFNKLRWHVFLPHTSFKPGSSVLQVYKKTKHILEIIFWISPLMSNFLSNKSKKQNSEDNPNQRGTFWEICNKFVCQIVNVTELESEDWEVENEAI